MYRCIIIFVLLIGCKKELKLKSNKIDIQGNWYSYAFFLPPIDGVDKNSIDNFNYSEFFFSKEKLYRYSNAMGFLVPMNYEIQKDSLFLFVKQDTTNTKDFIGRISHKSQDTLILKSSVDTTYFYRLPNKEILMSHFVENEKFPTNKFNKSMESYSAKFFKRVQEKFDAAK